MLGRMEAEQLRIELELINIEEQILVLQRMAQGERGDRGGGGVNTKILLEYFKILDVHNKNTLNDVQFTHFMREVTNFGKKDILMTFDMLDWDATGEIGFQQFYMMVCILLSSQHHVEKNFIFRHSRPVFELLDMDGGRTISPAEFRSSAFLFNLKRHALSKIFYEFDVSGDEQLNYKEFKMFTMGCIYMQEQEMKNRRLSFRRVRKQTIQE